MMRRASTRGYKDEWSKGRRRLAGAVRVGGRGRGALMYVAPATGVSPPQQGRTGVSVSAATCEGGVAATSVAGATRTSVSRARANETSVPR
jgi:hypothetical protein